MNIPQHLENVPFLANLRRVCGTIRGTMWIGRSWLQHGQGMAGDGPEISVSEYSQKYKDANRRRSQENLAVRWIHTHTYRAAK
jgi:hypothetical protein